MSTDADNVSTTGTMTTPLNDHLELCEHVTAAWRLLLALPDDERARVTEYLASHYAWADVEHDTRAASVLTTLRGAVAAQQAASVDRGAAQL